MSILASRVGQLQREYGIAGVAAPARWDAAIDRTGRRIADAVGPGQLILVQGASGSGKSTLLRRIGTLLGAHAMELPALHHVHDAVVDCLAEVELSTAMDLLGRFGLGEVHLCIAPVGGLSTGQQFRLRLALAAARVAHRGPTTLVFDEFATFLDPISACVISRTFARWLRQDNKHCAILATCRNDVIGALAPELVVSCDFGEFSLRAA